MGAEKTQTGWQVKTGTIPAAVYVQSIKRPELVDPSTSGGGVAGAVCTKMRTEVDRQKNGRGGGSGAWVENPKGERTRRIAHPGITKKPAGPIVQRGVFKGDNSTYNLVAESRKNTTKKKEDH